MRSLPFILPGAALLLCTSARAATTACTIATACGAAEMLFSNYRFDRTAPLDSVAAPAASEVMVSPIGASLNAASVFSSSLNGGNGNTTAESAHSIDRRPAAAVPAGFDGASGDTHVLYGSQLGSLSGLFPNSESSGVPVANIPNTPEPAGAGWVHGRAVGVGRFATVGPRLRAAPNGATGGEVPGLGEDTPSTVATPEPMPFLLIGSGLVVLGALARRRSAARS